MCILTEVRLNFVTPEDNRRLYNDQKVVVPKVERSHRGTEYCSILYNSVVYNVYNTNTTSAVSYTHLDVYKRQV